MHATTLILALASTLFHSVIVSAGPHGTHLDRSRIRIVHRRHHARRGESSTGCDDAGETTTQNDSTGTSTGLAGGVVASNQNLAANATTVVVTNGTTAATAGCTNGNWQCLGMTLQVCDHTNWVTMANCTGDNIVCSASGAVGCVWSWSVTGNSSASTGSTIGVADDDQYEDCDDDEDLEVAFVSGSSTITATVTSAIGQNLYAGQSRTASESVSTGTWTYNTSSTYGGLNATAGVTTTTKHGHGTATASVTATASATITGSTNSTGPVAAYAAPHWVVYSDYWLSSMPSVSDLKSYNRFILAFWMSNNGPVDNAQNWAWMDASYRQQVLAEYHAAGIALMVSAFGSTDAPTTWGFDPIQTAQKLAAYVVEYGLDGVDIDYEDMTAMNSNKAEAWLIPFQQELRSLLPSPYIISHAPVAPWFTSANDYASGAYVAIHQQVGWGIDFYNVQFYNQGDGVYCQCENLLFNSGTDWPSTSVMELNSYAKVPLDKIVIGKPMDVGAADNGYMSPATLSTCVAQAQAKGWNGGVMFWEWNNQAPSIMATVRA